MAFKFGINRRVKVSDMAGTPIFTQVGGEGSLSYKANSESIDISSKDDGYVKSVAMGQSTLMIDIDGVCNLPDTGLANLVTAFTAGTPVNITIVEGATSKFAGSVYVGNLSQVAANNQALKWSATLTLAGIPSVNTLFA